jgi:hypothetical protein
VENNESIAGRNGGRLLTGGVRGNKGGTGRPPNVIRQGFRKDLPTEARKLRAHVREMEKLVKELEPIRAKEDKDASKITTRLHDLERLMRARMQLAEFLAKYGLGTTVTETDTEGNDVPRPGILTIEERRAALMRVLSN